MYSWCHSEKEEPSLWSLRAWEQALSHEWVFQDSCHCGMGMCSSLSLDSQHMYGWPCHGYYSNLRAIYSNSLFLLIWNCNSPSSFQEWPSKLIQRSSGLLQLIMCIIISLSLTFSWWSGEPPEANSFSGGKLAIKDCSDATGLSLSSILHRAGFSATLWTWAGLQNKPSDQSLAPHPSPHFHLKNH